MYKLRTNLRGFFVAIFSLKQTYEVQKPVGLEGKQRNVTMTITTWKQKIQTAIEPALAEEIDLFENQIELKKQGKLTDQVFGETRLRRGAYGQRYDNGQRHDGVESRTLSFRLRRRR